jgi:hypothetical protein
MAALLPGGAGSGGGLRRGGRSHCFLFLTKVLLPHERELTADETEVAGVVGRVSAPIRAGGIGRDCVRATGRAAVRSGALRGRRSRFEKQEEVFVVRYEKGIAWVRRWEDAERVQGLRVQRQGTGTILPQGI